MVTASLADGLVGLGPIRGATPRWLTTLARLGFAAKGFVYVLIALVAAGAAFGSAAFPGPGPRDTVIGQSLTTSSSGRGRDRGDDLRPTWPTPSS